MEFIKSISHVCPMCGKQNLMRITKEQSIQYGVYSLTNELIQNVCTSIDAFGREFIKTGYCPKCQNKLFGAKIPADVKSRFIEVTEDIENHLTTFYQCREEEELPTDELTAEEKVFFLYFDGIENKYFVDSNGEIKELEDENE